jgi:hypothetical protein
VVTKLFMRLPKSKRENIRNGKRKTEFGSIGADAKVLTLGTKSTLQCQ